MTTLSIGKAKVIDAEGDGTVIEFDEAALKTGGGIQFASNTTYIDSSDDGLDIRYEVANGGEHLFTINGVTKGKVDVDGIEGMFKVIESDDNDAPNNTIYYSTDQDALTYRDANGTLFTIDLTAVP